MGPIEQQLRACLIAGINPAILEIANESPSHGLPPEAEQHFRIVIVSDRFAGLARLARHRLVHSVMGELVGRIHALVIQAWTSEEWEKRGGRIIKSPPCSG